MAATVFVKQHVIAPGVALQLSLIINTYFLNSQSVRIYKSIWKQNKVGDFDLEVTKNEIKNSRC